MHRFVLLLILCSILWFKSLASDYPNDNDQLSDTDAVSTEQAAVKKPLSYDDLFPNNDDKMERDLSENPPEEAPPPTE